jgi:GNAT superfamily N-acetyltransferase
MVPLDSLAVRSLRSWLGEPPGPGLLALHHALTYQRPGLWGDHARVPRSVVLVREGDDQLEAFGAGEPEPSVAWLAGKSRAVSLVAPAAWRDAVGARVGPIEEAAIATWTIDPFDLAMTTMLEGPEREPGAATTVATAGGPRRLAPTRRLTIADATGFGATAPLWALRGWGTFSALVAFGAAYGVPHGDGFASLAWIFDQSAGFDSIGVFTVPRYRRLGLGRAAASALITHISRRRGKVPLWSTPPDNDASLALAQALGFTNQSTEALIRWPPRPKPAALPQPTEDRG